MGSTIYYVVQPGDTLSQIAQSRVGSPVYGKKGTLRKILELNPELAPRAHLIRPEEGVKLSGKIRLPAGSMSEDSSLNEKSIDPSEPSEPSDEGRHSELGVATRVYFSRVNGLEKSNRSNATLLSTMNSGGTLTWSQIWSEHWKSALSIGADRISLNSSSTRILDNSSQTYTRLGAGLGYSDGNRFKMGFDTLLAEEIFYRATSLTHLQIDKVMIPRVGLSATYDLLNLYPFRLRAGAGFDYLMSTHTDTYSISGGLAYRGSLSFIEERKNRALSWWGGLFYGATNQETKDLEINRSDLGVALGLIWSPSK